uniref:PAS domain-containing protein n=1 Tax=Parastrongyloides trichosuri TaxID=131310 RepID=A0A0N4ZHL8_PARTI
MVIKNKTIKKAKYCTKKGKSHVSKCITQLDSVKYNNFINDDDNDNTDSNCYSIVNTFPSNRSLLGVVTISVPYGVVMKTNHFSNQEFEKNFMIGTSFLSKLCGNAAHNFLLNAFSGESNRVLYARFECANGFVQPCELQCDFGDSSSNSTSFNGALTPLSNEPTQTNTGFISPGLIHEKVAKIYLLTIPSAFKNFSMNDDLTFFTRHNHSNTLLYLDAKSIPYLGHFPSEMTGKGIEHFLYHEDQHIISTLHNLLRQNKNFDIIKTNNIRFKTHSGHVLRINSEWCGYLNPWTCNIEMIVGKHKICDDHEQLAEFLRDGGIDVLAEPINTFSFDSNFNSLHNCHILVDNSYNQTTGYMYSMSQKNKIAANYKTDSLKYIQKLENQNNEEKPAVQLTTKQVQYLDNVHRYFQNASQSASLSISVASQECDPNISTPQHINNNKQNKQTNNSNIYNKGLPLTVENLRNHTNNVEKERLKMWQERIRLMQRSNSNTPQSTISMNDIRASTTDSTNALQQED